MTDAGARTGASGPANEKMPRPENQGMLSYMTDVPTCEQEGVE